MSVSSLPPDGAGPGASETMPATTVPASETEPAPRVLLAGFSPFDGEPMNPSWLGVQAVVERGVPGADVSGIELPISFERAWPAFEAEIGRFRPQIVIACGYKRSARGIGLERAATNVMDAYIPDNDNAQPRHTVVDPDGPAAYWTRLPLRAILDGLAALRIPASLSSDAGTYVCNALFYSLMQWSQRHPSIIAGFVDIPRVNESGSLRGSGLPMRDIVEGIRQIVSTTTEFRAEHLEEVRNKERSRRVAA